MLQNKHRFPLKVITKPVTRTLVQQPKPQKPIDINTTSIPSSNLQQKHIVENKPSTQQILVSKTPTLLTPNTTTTTTTKSNNSNSNTINNSCSKIDNIEPITKDNNNEEEEDECTKQQYGRYTDSLLKKFNISSGKVYCQPCSYPDCKVKRSYKCYMHDDKIYCSSHLPTLLATLRSKRRHERSHCKHEFSKSKTQSGTCPNFAVTGSEYCTRHEKKKKQKL